MVSLGRERVLDCVCGFGSVSVWPFWRVAFWGFGDLGLGYWVWWIVTDRTGAGLDAGQGAVVGLGSGGGLEGGGYEYGGRGKRWEVKDG
jgi:hypothetical protein